MALIKCKECKSNISDKAKSCPKCGFPISMDQSINSHKLPLIVVISSVAIIITIMIILNIYQNTNGSAPSLFTGETVILEKDHNRLDTNSHLSFQMDINASGILQISVVEIFGNNIDFKLMKEGKLLYYSGVKAGKAIASINVSHGRYYLIVMNDNFLETKTVDVSAKIVSQQ